MPKLATPDSLDLPINDLSTPTYMRVSDLLRKDILAGRWPPGARLKIADLSQAYGVSQMPIREALQQLQGEGLLDIQPNRGASIRTVDERLIINIYDLRGAIESMLVTRAANSITEEQVIQLYAIEARFEHANAQSDTEAALRANKSFHHLVNAIADNPEALEILEKYSDLVSGLRRRFGFRPGRANQMMQEHRQLLSALSTHNAETACQITMEHCRHAKEDLIALLRGEGPEQ